MNFSVECSARSTCFDLPFPRFSASNMPAGFDEKVWSASVERGGGGRVYVLNNQ